MSSSAAPLAYENVVDEQYASDGQSGSDVGESDAEVSDQEDPLPTPKSSDKAAVTAVPRNSSPMPFKKGKVVASPQVRAMSISSPEEEKKKKAGGLQALAPRVNPFEVFGSWDRVSAGQIKIAFPTMDHTTETTNDLTRQKGPEKRFWKAPITFSYGNFTSNTIRIDNVPIPCHTGRNYGTEFVYLCLPHALAEAVQSAGKEKRPTQVFESTLVTDRERWWKIANKVEGKFGTIDKKTSVFMPRSLPTLFDSTGKGVVVNIVLRFDAKCKTEDNSSLTATVPFTIAPTVERAWLCSINQDIQLPAKVVRVKKDTATVATHRDVPTDDLARQLNDLGV